MMHAFSTAVGLRRAAAIIFALVAVLPMLAVLPVVHTAGLTASPWAQVSLLLAVGLAVIGFVVLFLHDERGLSAGEAALVLAASQLLGAGMRIGLGVWSDRLGSRIVPFRRVAVVLAALLGGAAVLLDAPLPVLVPALVVATGVSMGWNSLSFAAAAEIGGATRSGAAIGLQQTTLAAASAVVPVLFAFTVVATSWQTAFLLVALFPLAGWWTLRPLEARPASLSG